MLGHSRSDNCLRAMAAAMRLVFGAWVFLAATLSKAEGVKELAPDPDDVTMLYCIHATFGSFMAYNGPESSRLYIHINDPENEQIFFGFSRQASVANGTDGNLINTSYYFRVKDPNGNVVYGPQLINNTSANADTWALAAAGPAPVVGAGGYTPFTFDPTGLPAGDYYIEVSANDATPSAGTIAIKYWDITVATKGGSPQALNGRLWSRRWSLRTPSISQGADPLYTFYDRPFNGQIYLYTDDGFVTKVDFAGSGFRGLSFNLAYNETGVDNTGDVESDRRSVANANQTLTQYRIFLNDPDITAYPTGSIGEVVTEPVVLNCDLSNLCIAYSVTQIGYIFILLDFDQSSGAGYYDPGTADVMLIEKIEQQAGEFSPYERCTSWNGNDGLGNPVDLASPIPVYFSYAQGLVHFPVYDVEFNVNGFAISLLRPTVSGYDPKLNYDDVNITDLPGNGEPKVQVNGCTSPCHTWINIDYGDLNTINTWWYASQDFVISFQPSDCPLIAIGDYASSSVGTPVNIFVLANDYGPTDPTTVSVTGLPQPANGIVAVQPDGSLTYTPEPGFTGTDHFDYLVCSIDDPAYCDTATVYVNVVCSLVPGHNIIMGIVYDDVDLDGGSNVGEPGRQGVLVNIYEDTNGNGFLDAGEPLLSIDTTDSSGKYQFTLPPVEQNNTVRDEFNTNGSGAGSDGSVNWIGDWVEIGEADNFSNGGVRVTGNRLRIGSANRGARRSANLSGAASATLTFNFEKTDLDDANDFLVLAVAASAAGPFTNLVTYTIPNGTGNASFDISGFISDETTIRFLTSGSNGNSDFFFFDNVQIAFTTYSAAHYIVQPDSMLPQGFALNSSPSFHAISFIGPNNGSCDNDYGLAGADLSVVKTVNEIKSFIGDTVAFTLVLENLGPTNATGIAVTDLLPPGLSYVSDNTGGQYDENTGIWSIGDLAVGAESVIEISALVSSVGLLENTATISASDLPDPDSLNNQDAATVKVDQADLSLAKTVLPSSGTIGGMFTFTLTVKNDGPDTALLVVVTDTLASGLNWQSDDSGGTYDVGTGEWTIPVLPPGDSAMLNLTVEATTGGVFYNSAEITASPVHDPDSTPGNGNPAEDDLDSTCISVVVPFCLGDSHTLSAPSGLTDYQWYRNGVPIAGATSQTYIVTATVHSLDTITYTGTGIGDGLPHASECPAIFLKSGPSALAGSYSPVCEGDTILLSVTGTGGVAWSWSGPDGFTASQQDTLITGASVGNAGTYTITVTDLEGCTGIDSVTVDVHLSSTAGTALANDSLCLEGSGLAVIDLFDKINGEDPGGTWSVVAGTPGSNFDETTGMLNPNGLPIGTYTFRYTVPGTPPCPSDSEDWTITIYRCCPPQICLPVTATRNN